MYNIYSITYFLYMHMTFCEMSKNCGYFFCYVFDNTYKALIGRTLALAVAVCYRSSMLQELCVFAKLFNRMIKRAV